MNKDKLSKLQEQVRIGGKGSARRKKKVVHRTATTDDKKLQSSLKKLSVNNIPGIEEVNMIKDDGSVIHFNNPKVQASLQANTFAIAGHADNKQITDMLPGILNQLGPEGIGHLKRLTTARGPLSGSAGFGSSAGSGGLNASSEGGPGGQLDIDDDDEAIPELVENFDEASKNETGISSGSVKVEACDEGKSIDQSTSQSQADDTANGEKEK